MALFLEDSPSMLMTEETITTEEAYEGLLEAANKLSELNETLLIEDFTLHIELTEAVLNEEEQQEKKISFLYRAYLKVKEFIIKVVEKVSSFLEKVKSNLSNFWHKLTGKVKEDTVVEVPKDMVSNIENGIKNALDIAKDFGQKVGSQLDLKTKLNSLKDKIGSINKVKANKNSPKEKVKLSKLKALMLGGAITTVISGIRVQRAVVTSAESELKALSNLKGPFESRFSEKLNKDIEMQKETVAYAKLKGDATLTVSNLFTVLNTLTQYARLAAANAVSLGGVERINKPNDVDYSTYQGTKFHNLS